MGEGERGGEEIEEERGGRQEEEEGEKFRKEGRNGMTDCISVVLWLCVGAGVSSTASSGRSSCKHTHTTLTTDPLTRRDRLHSPQSPQSCEEKFPPDR